MGFNTKLVQWHGWFNTISWPSIFLGWLGGHPHDLGNLGYIPYDTPISKPSQVLQQPQGCSSHYPLRGALAVDPRSGYNVAHRSTQHVTQVYVANYPKYEMSTHPHRALYQPPANISDWWTIMIYILTKKNGSQSSKCLDATNASPKNAVLTNKILWFNHEKQEYTRKS